MDAQAFWNVIGNYNKQTWIIQIILFTFMLLAIMLSYMQKVKWAAKFSLGIVNLFIGIAFLHGMGQNLFKSFCLAIISALWGIVFLRKLAQQRGYD